jgi:putative membrane protein
MLHVLYFLVMAAAMLILSRILPGFRVDGIGAAIWASLVLALLNTIVRPILFLLTLPFTVLTLGLFLFVLNALILFLTARLVHGFHVQGWGSAILASVILGLVSLVWKAAVRERGAARPARTQ